jgi:hypothetical protein
MRFILHVFLFVLLLGCNDSQPANTSVPDTPVALATGDSAALNLATQVELASGGRDNWNAVRFLGFTFFNSRIWHWDKWANRYRVESLKRGYRIAGTLDGKETYLYANGKVETNPDSLSAYAGLAYKAWINDTYWLILPFKLRDPGVHLSYKGIMPIDSVTSAKCIEMTFEQVGVTPENKYQIFIDSTTHHIIYWSYFENKNDTLPGLSNPWTGYKPYGNILLSGGRGNRSIKDIQVFEKLPDSIFKDISK